MQIGSQVLTLHCEITAVIARSIAVEGVGAIVGHSIEAVDRSRAALMSQPGAVVVAGSYLCIVYGSYLLAAPTG